MPIKLPIFAHRFPIKTFKSATGYVTTYKLLGFGVAFAILLDATLIRALLVPALMRLFDERNWWAPKALKQFQINH
jgi:RND superfamily putative drug exporter